MPRWRARASPPSWWSGRRPGYPWGPRNTRWACMALRPGRCCSMVWWSDRTRCSARSARATRSPSTSSTSGGSSSPPRRSAGCGPRSRSGSTTPRAGWPSAGPSWSSRSWPPSWSAWPCARTRASRWSTAWPGCSMRAARRRGRGSSEAARAALEEYAVECSIAKVLASEELAGSSTSWSSCTAATATSRTTRRPRRTATRASTASGKAPTRSTGCSSPARSCAVR